MNRIEAGGQQAKQDRINYLEQRLWDSIAGKRPRDGKFQPLHPSRRIVKLVDDFISANIHSMLEIGCNTGYLSVYFTRKGFDYTGVDISAESIIIAGETFSGVPNCRFCVSKAEKLPFMDESFELVFSRDALHHCIFSRALDEIHRVLAKNGKAVFIETTITNNITEVASRYMKNETEYPLIQSEIEMIKDAFPNVTIEGYDFFRLLLRCPLIRRNRLLESSLNAIDDFLFHGKSHEHFTFLSFQKVFLISK